MVAILRHQALHVLGLAALCVVFTQAAEKIQIRAEKMTSVGNVEITYTGQVTLEHPSLKIKAEKISFTRSESNQQVIAFQAFGQPVKIQHWQQAENKLLGRANQIKYQRDSNQFILIGDAEINQSDGVSLRGEEIIYNAPPLGGKLSEKIPVFQGRKAEQ